MLELNLVEFRPRENIEETVRALALAAHQKGLELVCDIDRSVPEVLLGDSLRIRQVLVNLVGNAIKFTQRGEVVVGVQAQPGATGRPSELELMFTVRDTGIGIAQEKLASIFQAFTQADSSTTRQYGGTGLGLTISRRLVEMMGGRIEVDSELKRGSIFSFTAIASVRRKSGLKRRCLISVHSGGRPGSNRRRQRHQPAGVVRLAPPTGACGRWSPKAARQP